MGLQAGDMGQVLPGNPTQPKLMGRFLGCLSAVVLFVWLSGSTQQRRNDALLCSESLPQDLFACSPCCRKEVVGAHSGSSVHLHQQHVQVQQAAPSHPPEVPKFHSREMKTSLPQKETQETQETLVCFTYQAGEGREEKEK